MRNPVFAAVSLAILLAGCVAPKPAPAPAPPSAAPPRVSAGPAPTDWRDLPLAPGEWSWRDGVARFATADAELLSLSCDTGSRTIRVTAKGVVAPGTQASLVFTVSDGVFTLPASAGDGGIVARVSAGDSNLDKLAFSRGRFTIAAPAAGLQQTLLPARPEIGRVIDDCRR